MYVIPSDASCGWQRQSYLGCDGSFECRSWIVSSYVGSAQLMLAALGANMYLASAKGSSGVIGWVSSYL